MASSIIYRCNNDKVILLDLPFSIHDGQFVGTSAATRRQLICPPPLSDPFPSTEPSGSKRADLLREIALEENVYHSKIQDLIQNALILIKDALIQGEKSWCLPRPLRTESVPKYPSITPSSDPLTPESPAVILSEVSNHFPSIDALAGSLVSNPSIDAVRLVIGETAYTIPPRSRFLISNLALPLPFHYFLSNPLSPRIFDVILMDPPWPNRSVRHSAAYKMEYDYKELFSIVLATVQNHVQENGAVAVWVTNKSAIRRTVNTSMWETGYDFAEEWVWAKITDQGEPVSALNGIWRRPYESLLIFRKRKDPKDPRPNIWAMSMPRRIIASVPAHHSQKPCLKEMIGSLAPDPEHYSVLEIFARNLTAGWCSVGDQVLKFNCESYWSDP